MTVGRRGNRSCGICEKNGCRSGRIRSRWRKRRLCAWPVIARESAGGGEPETDQQPFHAQYVPEPGSATGGVGGGRGCAAGADRCRERSWPGEWYIHRQSLPLLESIQAGGWQPRTVFLSPFDNLICDRERTEQFFDFHYRIEIYVPKAKRQFGYYVLPLLHGDRFIGRMASQLDRKAGTYHIHALHTEEEGGSTRNQGRQLQNRCWTWQSLSAQIASNSANGSRPPGAWL